MRSPLIGPVVGYVRASAGDAQADALIREHDLSPTVETELEAVLPLSAMHAFYDAAERASGDPFLGIHIAAQLERGAFGIVEFLWRSASTLREALDQVIRYVSLLNEIVTVSIEEHDGEARIEQRVDGRPLCLGRHGNEFFVAGLVLQSRALSGVPCVPTRAWLAHPRPPDISELVELIGTKDLQFGAGANGVSFSPRLLDLPVVSADRALHSLLDRQARQTLAQRDAAPNASRFLGRIAESIRDRLEQGEPSLEDVAQSLRMSPRTLQRRLAAESTGFQQMIDAVREELALIWVRDPDLPLGEVAFRLGYADVSAFLRAFKRWTGTTPARLRAGGR